MFNKKWFYPYEFTSSAVIETTDNTTSITSGALVAGKIYTIIEAPIGGTPSFDGATAIIAGTTFVATGTGATWGTVETGRLIDVTTGTPTKMCFYNNADVVFMWSYIYNEDDFCVSYKVTDKGGNIIK